jgi:hypothetical protein
VRMRTDLFGLPFQAEVFGMANGPLLSKPNRKFDSLLESAQFFLLGLSMAGFFCYALVILVAKLISDGW